MATEVGTAYVTLVPSAKGFAAKMQSEVGGEVASAGTAAGATYSDSMNKSAGSRLKSGFGKVVGGLSLVAGPLLATAGVAAAGKFLGDSIGEAREAQKVGARTASVLKSMGSVAGVSAKQVGDLAGAISNKVGIDDEEIQSGENLLLTFKNIRNEAGKGNDVFNQTTQTMTDMSAATGQSMKSSAIQLGKALNDPIKGVSALARVGVSFTDQQKAQIKTLQDSGNTLGAQKIILKEVKSEFGGAAESMATPADKAKVAWGNFQESIGTVLLPVVDKLLEAFAAALPKIIAFGQAVGRYVGPVLSKVAGFIKTFIENLNLTRSSTAGARSDINGILTDLVGLVRVVVKILTWLWQHFGDDITRYVVGTFRTIVAVIKGALKIIHGVLDVVLGLLTGDWARAWRGVKEIVGGVWDIIKALVKQALLVLRTILSIGWKLIKLAAAAAWKGIVALIRWYVGSWIRLIKAVPKLIVAALRGLGSLLASLFRTAFDHARDAVVAAIGDVVAAVKALPGRLRALGGALKSAGAAIISAFIDGLRGGGGFVSDIAGKVWDALRGMINTAIDHINSALDFTINVGPKSFHIDAPNISHLASGGRATGATLAIIGEGREPETVLPDSMLRGLMERSAASGQALPRSLRLVVDGYEFNAYVDARADGRVGSAGALAAERGRARWQ